MKMDHVTNGKKPSVQWQPFIEERRKMMLKEQQSCACTGCIYSPPTTPALSESTYLSQDDTSNPSSPTYAFQQPQWSEIVLPSLASIISSKEAWSASLNSESFKSDQDIFIVNLLQLFLSLAFLTA